MRYAAMCGMPKRFAGWLAIAISIVLVGGCVTPPEQDPTVQRLTELDGRLLRIERILGNQSLLQQSQRIDDLYNEVRSLRGQVETLAHDTQVAKTSQREMYADLDKRLQALESRATSAPAAGTTGNEAEAYKQAFDLLKDGKYADAITAFQQFIGAHPDSDLIDNAYYWLGQARYVNKDFAAALGSFKTLADKYPDSPKVPDAWLKIGYCQYELKHYKEAGEALKRVGQMAPDSQSAKLAQQQLVKMQAEGH